MCVCERERQLCTAHTAVYVYTCNLQPLHTESGIPTEEYFCLLDANNGET